MRRACSHQADPRPANDAGLRRSLAAPSHRPASTHRAALPTLTGPAFAGARTHAAAGSGATDRAWLGRAFLQFSFYSSTGYDTCARAIQGPAGAAAKSPPPSIVFSFRCTSSTELVDSFEIKYTGRFPLCRASM